MIEDLDGATLEPTRRRHVIALSAVTAALALALFVALVAPPSVVSVAEAPTTAPSVRDAPTMTVVWGDEAFTPGSVRATLDQLRAQRESPLVCAAPRPDVWGEFVLGSVSYAVADGTRRAPLPSAYTKTRPRSGWLTISVYDRTGQQLLYTCGESDALAPRVDLTSIPR